MPKHSVVESKRDYVKRFGKRLGLPSFNASPSTLELDPALGKAAGRAYETLKHSPDDPQVKAAYDALKRETLLQFATMVKHGMKVEPWTKPGQPYANSKEMRKDVEENKHLWYFPTEGGFGGEESKEKAHPLLEKVPGTDTPYNDLFRAVHDYYAHAMHGHQFGPKGELRAWHEHAQMFSPLARRALTTETHGQNSWVNFGPHEPERLPVTERPYAEQKAALLPLEVWPHTPVTNRERHRDNVQVGALPKIVTVNGKQYVGRFARPKDRLANSSDVAALIRQIALTRFVYGPPYTAESAHDKTAHLLLADKIQELIGHENDPRETVVRGAAEHNGVDAFGSINHPNFVGAITYHHPTRTEDSPDGGRVFLPDVPEQAYKGRHNITGMRLNVAEATPVRGIHARYPVITWHVPPGLPNSSHHLFIHVMATPEGRPDVEGLHRLIDNLPKNVRKQWRAVAERQGWRRSTKAVKLARLRVAPGVANGQPFGGGGPIYTHTIHDGETGNRLGYVNIQPRNEGKTLHVQWIGRDDAAAGEDENSLGAEAMRSVLAGVAEHYPDAEFVSGQRVSGFRGRSGERVVVPIKRLKLCKIKVTKPLRSGPGWEEVAPEQAARPVPLPPEPTAAVASRPAEHPAFYDRGIFPRQRQGFTPAQRAWAEKNATPNNIRKFAEKHGYTNLSVARNHLVHLFALAASLHKRGQDMSELKFTHPNSGKGIHVRLLLAKPKKLARHSAHVKFTPQSSEHDQLVQAASEAHAGGEYTPMLVLADKLDELGYPGGALLRESHAAKVQRHAPAYSQLVYSPSYSRHPIDTPDGHLGVRLNLGARDINGEKLQPIMEVTHWPEDQDKGDYFTHSIPVEDVHHFVRLMKMLPRETAHKVISQYMELRRDHPARLARAPQRIDSAGSAAASAGSVNHAKRLEVVRQILAESGLTPAVVRAALAHDGGQSRPAFATVIKRGAHPDHLRYTAAWVGLMTGQPSLAVAQPNPDGEDFLHVISAPGTPDQLSEALKRAGVPKFTTERHAGGARAYVLSPFGKFSSAVESAARSIPNASNSSSRVNVYRVGSGSSSSADSRAAYRNVIDDFERAAGSTDSAPAGAK